MIQKETQNCYCGREKSSKICCSKIHEDLQLAATAEDLMRSRYTAFVLANGEYLCQSWYGPTQLGQTETKLLISGATSVRWLKLEILSTQGGGIEDTTGQVESKAYYLENGEENIIHENSKFIRENGIWMYWQ